MYKRLLNIPEDRRKSFFLFGPRGTGKTFWVRHTFKEHLYLDLLDADVYLPLRAQPKRLSHFIPKGYQGWIIIDEVQKIPALLDEVHRLIEQSQYCFILTGSSARSLKRHGSNLLAGRALTYTMHPLTAIELADDFDLKKSLQYGHLPAITHEPDPEHFLKTYVKTYLREEVQQEGLTRHIDGFYRFLETASLWRESKSGDRLFFNFRRFIIGFSSAYFYETGDAPLGNASQILLF
jgi:predicted AAA+ superfamily ATPase